MPKAAVIIWSFIALGASAVRTQEVEAGVLAAAQEVAASPVAAAPPATFAEHVAPILFEHCASCHRPGGSAPFSLLDYASVRPRAAQIAAATRSRAMPPWQADPEPGGFIGQRPLSAEAIATIQRWVEQGAPQGDLRRLASSPASSGEWQLGTPDLVLTTEQAYTLAAGGADRFRMFVLPIPGTVRRYVRGVEFRPHNPRVTHHANILLDRTPRSRERNEQDPGLGESGLLAATAEYPSGHLLGWTPGLPDPLLPKGLAWPLEPNTDLVVQLHLVPDGTPQPVAFSVGFYFSTDPPERTPSILRLGRRDIEIAPGQRDYIITDSYVLPVDAEVRALKPHAHYRARTIEGSAVLPDGSTRSLLRIGSWDFRWQHVYRYVAPVSLPKGTTLTMRYTYDNSAGHRANPQVPPQRVVWGPRSTDEMGDLWIQVLTRDAADAVSLNASFREKWVRDEIAGHETVLRRDARNLPVRHELGALYLDIGRWQEAAMVYEAALQLEPQSSAAHFNLATALMAGGRAEAAAARYLEAIRLQPDYAEAHNNLGNAFSRLGRLDEALLHYRAAVHANARHAGAHNNVGYLLMRRGELDAARPHFERAIELNAQLPDPHYNLGLLFKARGEAASAIAHLRRAASIRSDWAPGLSTLAWMLAATGAETLRDGPQAVDLATRAVELTGRRNADALDALAAAYGAVGDFGRAAAAIQEALDLGTGDAAGMRERKQLYARRVPYRLE